MTAHVADEIVVNQTLGEAPSAVDLLETVMPSAGQNRLQRQLRVSLQSRVVRTGHRSKTIRVDIDDQVGDYVLGARGAVVELHRLLYELPNRVSAVESVLGPRHAHRRVSEELCHRTEVTEVEKLRIRVHKVLDGLDVIGHWVARLELSAATAAIRESIPEQMPCARGVVAVRGLREHVEGDDLRRIEGPRFVAAVGC